MIVAVTERPGIHVAHYDAVIFDCDGVIFDSNAFKTKAFRQVFQNHDGAVVEQFIDYHRSNGGISRFKKIEVFYNEFLKVPPEKATLKRDLAAFGQICRDEYLAADYTPQALPKLIELSAMMPLYVASGSAEAELNDIFKARGLSRHFKRILGSPRTKDECVRQIVGETGTNALMVGDAASDWHAAQKAGIDFVFMQAFSDAREAMLKNATQAGFPVIENLGALKAGEETR